MNIILVTGTLVFMFGATLNALNYDKENKTFPACVMAAGLLVFVAGIITSL